MDYYPILVVFHNTLLLILLIPTSNSLVVNTHVHCSTLFSVVDKKPSLTLQIYSLDDLACSYCTILMHCLSM